MTGQRSGPSAEGVVSPLSQQPPVKVRDLPRGYLRHELSEYFRTPASDRIIETDYSIWRCAETGLEFSVPPQPGNTEFYEWVSGFAHYYPGTRWEYGQVAGQLRAIAHEPGCKVLDVGSGKGDFLQTLEFLPANSRYALDMNEPAIRACREKGLRAFRGTIESGLEEGFLSTGEFSAVTSFHCLEHVSKPVEFVRELARVVAPGGRMYLSTPASPMSFEDGWFDVLNHPPHHLTRWNLASYQKLASMLDLKLRYFVPPSNAFRQALQLFCIKEYGPTEGVPRLKLLKDLMRNGKQFVSDWRKMHARAGSDVLGGSDIILVELTVSR